MTKHLKNIISKTCNSLGYEIIPTWRINHLQQSHLISKIFKIHSINTVIDVGANKGQYINFLRNHVEYKGKIISFEPILSNYIELKNFSSHDPDLSVYHNALGRENCNKEINIMKADVFSSFLHPTNKHVKDLEQYNAIERTEIVSMRRLDEVFIESNCKPEVNSIYIKLDTQGFDIEVIAGLGSSLYDIRALQTEVPILNIYEGMPSMFSTMEFLNAANFELAGLFPVSKDKNLRVIEFDAIFLNKRFFIN